MMAAFLFASAALIGYALRWSVPVSLVPGVIALGINAILFEAIARTLSLQGLHWRDLLIGVLVMDATYAVSILLRRQQPPLSGDRG